MSNLDQVEDLKSKAIDEILNDFWNGAMDCALSDDFKNEDENSNIDKRQVYKNNLRSQARNAIKALYNTEDKQGCTCPGYIFGDHYDDRNLSDIFICGCEDNCPVHIKEKS